MILHRLRLTNFRGVADREIRFPDRGVVVVCGPNEIGKSSMLEALDLLLSYRDRSNHRNVKQVKPTHADVGADVEAEISTGCYRFVYRKRFHRKQRTELEIIEPRREQLTGDEAHERVEAMLEETVDTTLWDAQRVLQAASTEAVALSGSDALARALDAAAGAAEASPGGTESLLVDLVEAEYLRYFTPTGRPTRDWKSAIDRVAAAEAEVAVCRDRVAEVDERVSRHELLRAELADLDRRSARAVTRRDAARTAHAAVAELSEELSRARMTATAAAATAANSALADGQRRELVGDVTRRAEALSAGQAELADAGAAVELARQASARADATLAAAEACAAREEADRLAGRLQRIDDADRRLAGLAGRLDAVTITEEVFADIERAAALVERLEGQLRADAATVAFSVPADLEVTVDGVPRVLPAGEQWLQPATSAVVVDVPGVLSVRVDPGATAVKLDADLRAAQRILREALAQGGAVDLAAARAAEQQRRELTAESDKLTAALEALRDGDDVAELRVRLAGLQAVAAPAGAGTVEISVARAAAEAGAADLTAASTRSAVLQERVRTAEAGLAEITAKLTTLRSAVPDEEVAAQAAAHADALREADRVVAALQARHTAADPDAVAAELAAAVAAAESIAGEQEAARLELHNLGVELGVIGTEGRQGRLDDAEAELEHARAEYDRIRQRADAAAVLRETILRHRDNTRRRYVQPYRAELERLGRTVFGPTFEVDVDADLTINSRTLAGSTVPFGSLSGGAREQLGILARLAGAALVADADTVPVVIDDALGFSDPDRLVKMGAVFNTVGDRGQVIVLTCTPGRYDGIADAEVIRIAG